VHGLALKVMVDFKMTGRSPHVVLKIESVLTATGGHQIGDFTLHAHIDDCVDTLKCDEL
jgi:hypothetical protein